MNAIVHAIVKGRPPRPGAIPLTGFTLIELLVVISIIALLASLTVGLTSVASRKSREARIKADLNQYVTGIESYRMALGFYPPDNPGRPSTNALFYELSGTVYDRNVQSFSTPQAEPITEQQIRTSFKPPGPQGAALGAGFANSATSPGELKFTMEFKPNQYKQTSDARVELLAVPVKGPNQSAYLGAPFNLAIPAADGSVINPWMYDSSSRTRNNPDGFDLWTDVILGRKIVRISNWDRDPVVIGDAP